MYSRLYPEVQVVVPQVAIIGLVILDVVSLKSKNLNVGMFFPLKSNCLK